MYVHVQHMPVGNREGAGGVPTCSALRTLAVARYRRWRSRCDTELSGTLNGNTPRKTKCDASARFIGDVLPVASWKCVHDHEHRYICLCRTARASWSG